MLRDIARGEDPQIAAVIEVLEKTRPDIVVLQSFDYDLTGAAVQAFLQALDTVGVSYPHWFSARPNTGMPTDIDLDGNGRHAEARDAQGFGSFSGRDGMVLLSRYPILTEEVQDYSDVLWRDLPDALLPVDEEGAPFPSQAAWDVQRLSTTAHWVVPVEVPEIGRVDFLTFHATPPVFDGPEDRNGRRNHDEIRFWQLYLDGVFGPTPPGRFVLLGGTNQDPDEGEGRKAAIRNLLSDPRFQDPVPTSEGSARALADPDDTADWGKPGLANMRVDYVLPSADWHVAATGVYWPDGPDLAVAETASHHRLVWIDLIP